uniref:Uncharacterized protein n=1 Tax=Cacopsylla melanoneura TaxID=428564 RepID=A0A8D8RWT0_9HEMI
MPVGHVLVGDTRGDVEHDDGTLTLDIITVSESSKLFLSCRIPHIESDCSSVCMEHQRMHFNTQCGNVFLFKLSRQVAFDEGCLSCTTITNKDTFEGGHVHFSGHFERILFCTRC